LKSEVNVAKPHQLLFQIRTKRKHWIQAVKVEGEFVRNPTRCWCAETLSVVLI